MLSQKKPFAINDIVQNLHNKVTKAETTRILETLVEMDKITSRTFGKIVIYSCKDPPIDFETEYNDSSIDEKYSYETLAQLTEEIMELERDKNKLKKDLQGVLKEPSNEQLTNEISNLKSEIETAIQRMKNIEENSNPENEEECEQIMKVAKNIEKEIKSRNKNFKELYIIIKDQVKPKSMDEFLENLGIEEFQ